MQLEIIALVLVYYVINQFIATGLVIIIPFFFLKNTHHVHH